MLDSFQKPLLRFIWGGLHRGLNSDVALVLGSGFDERNSLDTALWVSAHSDINEIFTFREAKELQCHLRWCLASKLINCLLNDYELSAIQRFQRLNDQFASWEKINVQALIDGKWSPQFNYFELYKPDTETYFHWSALHNEESRHTAGIYDLCHNFFTLQRFYNVYHTLENVWYLDTSDLERQSKELGFDLANYKWSKTTQGTIIQGDDVLEGIFRLFDVQYIDISKMLVEYGSF